MHEVATLQGAIRTALECMQQSGASRVTEVQLAIGVSDHFSADAVYQYFAVLTKGTPVEGASLSIQWLPATYQCFSCLHRFESGEPSEQVMCPRCGGLALAIEHQDVCRVSSIEVSFGEEAGVVGLHMREPAAPGTGMTLLAGECAFPAAREASQ
jgi:hydrogenase nickel incorporation protein HypA/HybF